MKIHIVSLQRSGSKSLYNAIHAAMPNPLKFENGDPLGEFFHCWSEYGYKFGPDAEKPFDQYSDILFRTNPGFKSYGGMNFTPSFYQGKLLWKPCEYRETLTYSDIERRTKVLYFHRHAVVKTQLASLLEEFDSAQRIPITSLVLDRSLFTHTIFLIPSDLVRWLCSNYLCDHSGVFVQCKSQEEAAAQFKKNPVIIPTEYLELLSSRYRTHVRLSRDYQTAAFLIPSPFTSAPDLVVKNAGHKKCTILGTRDLMTNDPYVASGLNALLHNKLGLDVHVKQEAEFSAFDYSTMIANYDEVVHAADQLRGT